MAAAIQGRHPPLQLLQPRPSAFQYPHLGIKLIPRYEIELGEACTQHCAKIVLQVSLYCPDTGRHALNQTADDLVDLGAIHVMYLNILCPDLTQGVN